MHDPVADGADAGAFVAKWRGAWPEWSLVEGFLPAAHRPLVDAWQALQFEWQEATWGGADARPGEAKLAWWAEELAGWSSGRRRHPLGALLLRQQAPWRDIAAALPSLLPLRVRPATSAAAWASLQPVASAVASAEAALFTGRADAHAVAACWLHARLARHPTHAAPLDLAPHGDTPAHSRWIDVLLSGWPEPRGVTRSRGIALALAHRRLKRGDAAAPLPPWSALWTGWRAARQ
jgi:hypothetical protein